MKGPDDTVNSFPNLYMNNSISPTITIIPACQSSVVYSQKYWFLREHYCITSHTTLKKEQVVRVHQDVNTGQVQCSAPVFVFNKFEENLSLSLKVLM